MQAPLGLAVIGGLVFSTFATLLVVPSVFAVVIGNKAARSPSIYPGDVHSRFYDPLLSADTGDGGAHTPHSPAEGPGPEALPTPAAVPDAAAAPEKPDPPAELL